MNGPGQFTGKQSRWLYLGLLLGGFVLGLAMGWVVIQPPSNSNDARLGSQTPLYTTLQAPAGAGGGPVPLVGSPAPDFSLKTLGGGTASLSQYRGQPLLVNFWASWCPPCRLEMPDLVRVYEAHKGEGFVILGVNLTFQDSLPDIQAFVDEFNMTFPVLLDEDGNVTNKLYQLRGLPLSVFVNRDGLIVRLQIGAMTAGQIEEYVQEILG